VAIRNIVLCHFLAYEKILVLALFSLWAVYSQEIFWFSLLLHFGFAPLAPQPTDQSLDEWWRKVDNSASGGLRKGLNSLVILGAWSIWRHRNDCVFNGATPNVIMVLALGREEAHWWSLA
jgi:hypothetical protein